MALFQVSTLPLLSNTIKIKKFPLYHKSCFAPLMAEAKATMRMSEGDNQTKVRRSGNYQPTVWKHEFVQSLTSEFKGQTYERRINKLKEDVKRMLRRMVVDHQQVLELVDNLQRLGISYHFEDEIMEILEQTHKGSHWSDDWKYNLHATALEFRLLRQHGFNIPQDVFSSFKDETGDFKAFVCDDVKGMLSLYEASYLSIEGECIMDEARCFTTKHLTKYISTVKDESLSSDLVRHALELPLHWRIPRLEAKWYIDMCERRVDDTNSTLLELAKLDFNRVQSIHQEDLKYTSRWWWNTGLGQKLRFGRDRLVENFFWTVGLGFEPKLGYLRRMTTKIAALITIIDDVYDVYGTLDELQLFTCAVERWDIDAIDQLPEYMKMCFLALHNMINEMAFDALRDHGIHIVPYLRKTWADLCKSYLLEAKWYHNNYSPTLQEYMDNAWISISGPLTIIHLYVFVANPIKMEDLESLKDYPNIIRWLSLIFRLENDLKMSSDELERGDTPKSIECYMREKGASREDAVEHMQYLIDETWKKINGAVDLNSNYSQTFINSAMNLVRMAKFMYQHERHGAEQQKTRDHVFSLLIQPLPIS